MYCFSSISSCPHQEKKEIFTSSILWPVYFLPSCQLYIPQCVLEPDITTQNLASFPFLHFTCVSQIIHLGWRPAHLLSPCSLTMSLPGTVAPSLQILWDGWSTVQWSLRSGCSALVPSCAAAIYKYFTADLIVSVCSSLFPSLWGYLSVLSMQVPFLQCKAAWFRPLCAFASALLCSVLPLMSGLDTPTLPDVFTKIWMFSIWKLHSPSQDGIILTSHFQ